MASGIDFSAVPELDVEEKLFCALTYGPYEQNEGLLDSVYDVDVRMLNHRTFLHVGVRLGKVDWVEELLARGADPNLEDDCHLTVMSLAEEMLRRFPEDSDHRQVRKLLSMVHRRDHEIRRRVQTPSARSAASSTPPVCQSDLLSAMANLSSSANGLKEEMRLLRAEFRSSLEELKEKLYGREELMRCLDVVVTSSIEDLTSLSGYLTRETTLETPLPPSNMADERSECVDGMMRRTYVYGGEEGESRMRKLYERLYDEDVVTKCLLKFLSGESRFVAKVDCGSDSIERMKETVVDLDGEDWSGSDWISFVEFSTNTVYLGANWSKEVVAAWFADALAQMSLLLAFNNGGKPYEGGDIVCEKEFKRAFEEAKKEKRKKGDALHPLIGWALDWNIQTARESYLAASVPSMITYYGSEEGTHVLREQVPRLLHYFKEHVVSKLLAEAEE